MFCANNGCRFLQSRYEVRYKDAVKNLISIIAVDQMEYEKLILTLTNMYSTNLEHMANSSMIFLSSRPLLITLLLVHLKLFEIIQRSFSTRTKMKMHFFIALICKKCSLFNVLCQQHDIG